MPDELPQLTVSDASAWRAWLAEHCGDPGGDSGSGPGGDSGSGPGSGPGGVWLVLAKKGTTGPTTLRHADALDEALCHGWIDGQVRKRDERTYLQRFTPHAPRSAWSQLNVANVERLLAAGRMHPAGLAQMASAQADGRWQAAYAGPGTIEVPPDLASALAADPGAQAMFDVLTSQNRYAILYRINTAKQAATRARRIRDFVDMLARHETIYPQRRRPNP